MHLPRSLAPQGLVPYAPSTESESGQTPGSLVHVLLNHCVESGMSPLILGCWKPGGERSKPQLLDLTSRSLGIILMYPGWSWTWSWSNTCWGGASRRGGLTLCTSPRGDLGTSASRPPKGLLLLLNLCRTLCLWLLLCGLSDVNPNTLTP